MTKSPDLTLVVPCFNEAARIAETVRALTSWFPDHAEILVIDDGSSDETFEIVRELGSRNASVRAHRLPSNRGKGAAVRAAIPIVTGEKAVLMDADLAFDRASIELAVTALDEVDVVLGNRRHGQSRYSVPVRLFGFLYRRHLVGLAFNLFVRWLVGFGFRDTQCGLKGFRTIALREIGPSLTTDGFATDVEILLVARALHLRLSEIPVCVTYHSAASSVRLLRSGLAMSGELFRIAARRVAGRYSPKRVRAAASRATLPQPSQPQTGSSR